MPYFVFRGFDGSNGQEIRGRVRPAHRAYIRQEIEGCRAVAGGVLVDDAGERMIGTLLVLDARDRSSAERFLAGDPYAAEGLFERTELVRWEWALGQPA